MRSIWWLAALTGCAAAPKAPEIVRSPDPVAETHEVSVTAVIPDGPARAAVAAFVPSLAGNRDFERLVGQALIAASRSELPKRAVESRKELAKLRGRIAAAGLPDVVVGVPYRESHLRSDLVSPACAAGPWQFLPEVAVDEGLAIRNCTIETADGEQLWTPTDALPSRERRPYLSNGCAISHCEVDQRLSLDRSTAAALHWLDRASRDTKWVNHPDRIPLTLMAFNAGSGGVAHFLGAIGDEAPFDVASACATGDCLVLPHETAWYVPNVVAAAAIVACYGGSVDVPELADWPRSDLCAAMYDAGLGPAPVDATTALAAAAKRGLTIGILPLTTAGYGMDVERNRVEYELVATLLAIPGVTVVQGVPGDDAAALIDEGASVVIQGELGRRADRTWLRLSGTRDVFAMVDLEHIDAADLVADALLGPTRDHQSEALAELVEARRGELLTCLPAQTAGSSAVVSLQIDADGAPIALTVGPDSLDAQAVECLQRELQGLTFPKELSGAVATLAIGVDGPALADAEEAL